MDARQPDAVALAESICRILLASTTAVQVCLSPVIGVIPIADTFNMIVETFARGKDLSADVLLFLYNTYLGCGRMGEFNCIKSMFDDIALDGNHYRARVGVAMQKGDLPEIDVASLVSDAFIPIRRSFAGDHDNGFIMGILEMFHSEGMFSPSMSMSGTALIKRWIRIMSIVARCATLGCLSRRSD